MMLNAYEILGVAPDATSEQIKESYYRKARIYHPDSGGRAEDFIVLKQAYELLCDEKRRMFMGTRPLFSQTTVRIQPSLSQTTSQLFENLQALSDRLKSIVNR